MSARETVTGIAPAHWAAFFINGDAEGMNADDIAQAEGFADWLGAWPVSCGDSEFFAWTHDANRLGVGGATCVEYVGLIERATA